MHSVEASTLELLIYFKRVMLHIAELNCGFRHVTSLALLMAEVENFSTFKR